MRISGNEPSSVISVRDFVLNADVPVEQCLQETSMTPDVITKINHTNSVVPFAVWNWYM